MFAPRYGHVVSFASRTLNRSLARVFRGSSLVEVQDGEFIQLALNEWPHLDLNQGPTGYEPAALTN